MALQCSDCRGAGCTSCGGRGWYPDTTVITTSPGVGTSIFVPYNDDQKVEVPRLVQAQAELGFWKKKAQELENTLESYRLVADQQKAVNKQLHDELDILRRALNRILELAGCAYMEPSEQTKEDDRGCVNKRSGL
jgi:hypothetical protein